MQAVAAEMNLSETAFVVPRGTDGFGLRWFTPTVEVDLCGHATLASAHVLWESGRLATDGGRTLRDPQRRAHRAHEPATMIELDFPADPVRRRSTPDADLARGPRRA